MGERESLGPFGIWEIDDGVNGKLDFRWMGGGELFRRYINAFYIKCDAVRAVRLEKLKCPDSWGSVALSRTRSPVARFVGATDSLPPNALVIMLCCAFNLRLHSGRRYCVEA
ncbi:hypothetical protein LENED_002710 [Lentinula edodes]|uniref:Uncharacterized protein n=1 Tax=Lentinula edodes TaxID=5353 RepID=A0A1Q3E1T2_LENED|nr:hypothetical protein LENED_002710 [Lentinula edodes]